MKPHSQYIKDAAKYGIPGTPLNIIWADIGKLNSITAHPTFSLYWTLNEPTSFDDERNIMTLNALTTVLNYKKMVESGNYVPLKREHANDGLTYGEVVGMRIDREYVQAGFIASNEQTRAEYNAGLIRQVSPAVQRNFLDPHTLEELAGVIVEVSYTSDAHQRNLRDLKATNVLNMSKEGTTMAAEPLMEAPEEQGENTDVQGQLDAMQATLAMILEAVTGDVSENTTEMDEDSENARLSRHIQDLEKQVASYQDKITRNEIEAAGVDSAVDIDALVKLSRVSPELYTQALQLCSCRMGTSPVQEPIGNGAPAPSLNSNSERPDIASLARKAKDEGVKSSNVTQFLKDNSVSLSFRNEFRDALKKLS